MATDSYDDKGVKSETIPGFSFRKMFKRWTGKILPDRGSLVPTKAAAAYEGPTKLNSGVRGTSARSSTSFVLPEVDVGAPFKMNAIADINKPLPPLPPGSRSPENELQSAVDRIIERQAETLSRASEKLKLGKLADAHLEKWAELPPPAASKTSLYDADKTSKLSPGAASHPLAAMRNRRAELQGKPSAFGPLQAAGVAIIPGAKIVQIPGNNAVLPKAQPSAEAGMINRSPSVFSSGSTTSIDSTFSAVSSKSTNTSTSIQSSVAEAEHPEALTRPPLDQLYSPGDRSRTTVR